GPSTPASLPGREGSRLVAAYLDAVAACQAQYGAQAYPGSPWLVANALRADDRLACCELQPEEASALKALFRGDARIAVHARDGYEATRALLPPTPRRGLVLVDPPYEAQLAEFDAILDALRSGSGRWPEGVYLVWYPVKQRRSVQPFLRAAAQLPVRSAFTAELLVRPDDSPLRMNGSGMLVLNAPWQFDATAEQALHALLPALDEGGGTTALRWLRRPSCPTGTLRRYAGAVSLPGIPATIRRYAGAVSLPDIPETNVGAAHGCDRHATVHAGYRGNTGAPRSQPWAAPTLGVAGIAVVAVVAVV